jgi:predicted nucleic acid-binding protein
MAVLLDTSFLLAVASPRDANHEVARAAMRDLVDSRIVGAPVLPEMFYVIYSAP